MVLALSTFNQGTYIRKMMESGASGYLLKNAGKQEIIEAIKLVVKGKTYFSFDAIQTLKSITEQQNTVLPLTKREKEVLNHLVNGLSYKMIASQCSISYETVHSHVKKIYEKLHVNSKGEAVAKALRNKLV